MSRLLWTLGFGAVLGFLTLGPAPAGAQTRKFDDISFLQFAGTAGLMEIKAGKMAKEHATSPKVREFAERMIKDHADADKELKRVATALDVSLPKVLPRDHQEVAEKMAKMRGRDFDQAYMEQMVKDHEKVVERFTAATKEAKNERVRAFAEKTLPTLKEHLELARTVKAGLAGGTRR
jgi:putative membrane protein